MFLYEMSSLNWGSLWFTPVGVPAASKSTTKNYDSKRIAGACQVFCKFTESKTYDKL